MKSRKIHRHKSKIYKRRTNKYHSRKVKKQKTKRRRLVKRKPRKTRVSRKKKGGLLPASNICCKAEDVKFVKAHGATASKIIHDGEGGIGSFLPDKIIIPPDTFVITLNKVGETSPYCARLDEEIKRFYESKNTLFNNKDKSQELSPEGLGFQTHLLKNVGIDYKFKNHIPGMSMNNISLNFKDNCTQKACSIDCLSSSGKWYRQNCLPKSRDNPDSNVIKTTLSNLLEDQGTGVYIIQVCRSLTIPKGLPQLEEQYNRVARQISSDAGITQDQYDYERKLSEDYFTRIQAPPYGTPVTTTSLSNEKYSYRPGMIVEPTSRLKPGRVAVLLDGEKKPISVKRTNITINPHEGAPAALRR